MSTNWPGLPVLLHTVVLDCSTISYLESKLIQHYERSVSCGIESEIILSTQTVKEKTYPPLKTYTKQICLSKRCDTLMVSGQN